MPNTTPHDGRARSTTARPLVHAHLAILFIEQRPGVFQVGGVEALDEPAVDLGEHRARFMAEAPSFEPSCEAGRLQRRVTQLQALTSSDQTAQKVSAIAAVFAVSCSGLSPQLGGKISMELARCHSGSTHSRT